MEQSIVDKIVSDLSCYRCDTVIQKKVKLNNNNKTGRRGHLQKKSRIWETPNFSTDADNRTAAKKL